MVKTPESKLFKNRVCTFFILNVHLILCLRVEQFAHAPILLTRSFQEIIPLFLRKIFHAQDRLFLYRTKIVPKIYKKVIVTY